MHVLFLRNAASEVNFLDKQCRSRAQFDCLLFDQFAQRENDKSRGNDVFSMFPQADLRSNGGFLYWSGRVRLSFTTERHLLVK